MVAGDRLFLGAEEDDFILDGFSIRRFTDVKKIEIKDDKCIEIIRAEGISDKIQIPKADLTDWYSAFSSLSELGINIIIEKENLVDDECRFAIGRIEKVLRSRWSLSILTLTESGRMNCTRSLFHRSPPSPLHPVTLTFFLNTYNKHIY